MRICSRSLASRLDSGSSSSRIFGSRDEAAREREALLLAARQLRSPGGSRSRRDATDIERLARRWSLDLGACRSGGRARPAAERRRSRTPSCAARSRRTGTPCRCRARSPARRRRRRRRTRPRRRCTMRPASGRFEPGEAAQRRGLAAARRPEQREEPPARDAEADAVDRVHLGVAPPPGRLAQVLHREHVTPPVRVRAPASPRPRARLRAPGRGAG